MQSILGMWQILGDCAFPGPSARIGSRALPVSMARRNYSICAVFANGGGAALDGLVAPRVVCFMIGLGHYISGLLHKWASGGSQKWKNDFAFSEFWKSTPKAYVMDLCETLRGKKAYVMIFGGFIT